MEARNINDIVKVHPAAARVACKLSNASLTFAENRVLVFRPLDFLLARKQQQIAGTNSRRITMLSI